MPLEKTQDLTEILWISMSEIIFFTVSDLGKLKVLRISMIDIVFVIQDVKNVRSSEILRILNTVSL